MRKAQKPGGASTPWGKGITPRLAKPLGPSHFTVVLRVISPVNPVLAGLSKPNEIRVPKDQV